MEDYQTFAAGPSAQEWRDHKDIIIQLYRSKPLNEVMREMKYRYKFVATKRMYDTRFRHWKISKVLKRAQKEVMIREISEKSDGRGREPQMIRINPNDLKKLVRHAQTENRNARRQGIATAGIELPINQHSLHRNSENRRAAWDTQEEDESRIEHTASKDVESEERKLDSSQLSTPSSSSADFIADEWPVSEGGDLDIVLSGGLYFDSLPSNCRSEPSRTPFSLSPSPPLASSSEDRNKESILTTLKSCFSFSQDELLRRGSVANSILSVGAQPETKAFWSNLKNHIYLWKISDNFVDSQFRSLEAWNKACKLMPVALSSQPFDFCLEILVILSLSNIKHTSFRRRILSDLADRITALFGMREHPFPALCDALCASPDPINMSRLALEHLLSMVKDEFGTADAAYSKITTSLITSMRQAGQLTAAKAKAETALTMARQTHGPHSEEARKTAVQLGHVLTSLGEHGEALSVRRGVIEEPVRWPASLSALSCEAPPYRTDDIAAYAMEDMAEYYARFGNIQECMVWLGLAEAIALNFWGDSVSTKHISDKLNNLRSGVLDGQVVDGKLAVEYAGKK